MHNEKVYTTGDTVSGEFTLRVLDKIDTKGITLSLLGKSVALNGTWLGSSYIVLPDEHTVLDETCIVFPPEEVRALTTSDSFTLAPGTYTYPFSFKFPDKDENCLCKERKGIFHHHGFTKKTDQIMLPPSFTYEKSWDNLCYVQYTILATVKKSAIKFNMTESHKIMFYPPNDKISYAMKPFIKSKTLIPDYNVAENSTKYQSVEATQSRKSFFQKMIHPRSTKIAFELKVDFLPSGQRQTELGWTNRYVKAGVDLPVYLRMYLRTKTFGGFLEKNDLAVSIKQIKVKVKLNLRFLASSESSEHEKMEIYNSNMNIPLSFVDFEETPVENSGSEKAVCYSKEIIPNWWKCRIPPEAGSSFWTCNIKRDMRLHITVTLASSDYPDKLIPLKCKCPIILGFPESNDYLPPYHNDPIPPFEGDTCDIS